MKNKIKSRGLAPYFFIAPFILIFLTFGLFPILFSLFLAFQSWDPLQGLGGMEYVGSQNIEYVLADDVFHTSLYNTLWLALASGIPQHLIAIPLAFIINEKLGRVRDTVMGIYFLPYITSTVAIAIMFGAIFSNDYGFANSIIQILRENLGATNLLPERGIDWLGDPQTVKPVVAFVVFWRYLGFNTMLYLAALQAIPRAQYEAAWLDGSKGWRTLWYVILPQLKPIMFFGVTLSVIGGLQLFEEPFILTGGKGGVEYSGMTTAMYLYRTAFEFNDFGLASAMSWVLFLVILILTYITHRMLGAKN